MSRPTSADVRRKARAYREGYPLWDAPTGTHAPIVADPYCADWLDLLADLLDRDPAGAIRREAATADPEPYDDYAIGYAAGLRRAVEVLDR